MRIVKMIAVWTLQFVVGLLFVLVGVMKFQDPIWARNFARWGYPDGFYMVVGVLEALGGAALLVPRLATYAALLLMTMMTGASVTHLVHGELKRLPVPLVYLLVIALVGWMRRTSAFRFRRASTGQHAVV